MLLGGGVESPVTPFSVCLEGRPIRTTSGQPFDNRLTNPPQRPDAHRHRLRQLAIVMHAANRFCRQPDFPSNLDIGHCERRLLIRGHGLLGIRLATTGMSWSVDRIARRFGMSDNFQRRATGHWPPRFRGVRRHTHSLGVFQLPAKRPTRIPTLQLPAVCVSIPSAQLLRSGCNRANYVLSFVP